MSKEKPYRVQKFQGEDCIMGPGTTWLWMEPTVAEALICLNGAYEEGANSIRSELSEARAALEEPLKMVMYCPSGHQHIDEGEWATRPHKTHQCQHITNRGGHENEICGLEWRPVDRPTVGVLAKSGVKPGAAEAEGAE